MGRGAEPGGGGDHGSGSAEDGAEEGGVHAGGAADGEPRHDDPSHGDGVQRGGVISYDEPGVGVLFPSLAWHRTVIPAEQHWPFEALKVQYAHPHCLS